MSKKMKSKAKEIASSLINDMGPMKAEEYVDTTMREIDHSEWDIDGKFLLIDMWMEVGKEIRRWEVR